MDKPVHRLFIRENKSSPSDRRFEKQQSTVMWYKYMYITYFLFVSSNDL